MSKFSDKIVYCHDCDCYYIKELEKCKCNVNIHTQLKELGKIIDNMSPEELQKIFDKCKPSEEECIKYGLLERIITKE